MSGGKSNLAFPRGTIQDWVKKGPRCLWPKGSGSRLQRGPGKKSGGDPFQEVGQAFRSLVFLGPKVDTGSPNEERDRVGHRIRRKKKGDPKSYHKRAQRIKGCDRPVLAGDESQDDQQTGRGGWRRA